MVFASTLTMGAASVVGCSDDSGDTTLVDSGGNVAAYGAPIDARPPTDTATASEAATDSAGDADADTDTGSAAGAYGLPPSDGG